MDEQKRMVKLYIKLFVLYIILLYIIMVGTKISNLNLYYNSDKCRILYIEGNIWKDEKLMLSLKKTDYIFYQFTWNIEKVIDTFP